MRVAQPATLHPWSARPIGILPHPQPPHAMPFKASHRRGDFDLTRSACAPASPSSGRGDFHFTSNVAFVAGLPSRLISTWYLPAGQPSGLLMWNVVVAVPEAVETDSVFWLTGWPWS